MNKFRGDQGVAAKVLPETMDVINHMFSGSQWNNIKPSSKTNAIVEVLYSNVFDQADHPVYLNVIIGGLDERGKHHDQRRINTEQIVDRGDDSYTYTKFNIQNPDMKEYPKDDFRIRIGKNPTGVSIEISTIPGFEPPKLSLKHLGFKAGTIDELEWRNNYHLSDEQAARILQDIISARIRTNDFDAVVAVAAQSLAREQELLVQIADTVSAPFKNIKMKVKSATPKLDEYIVRLQEYHMGQRAKVTPIDRYEIVDVEANVRDTILISGDVEEAALMWDEYTVNREGEQQNIGALIRDEYDIWLENWMQGRKEEPAGLSM